jgi:FkbM family methyltransferase
MARTCPDFAQVLCRYLFGVGDYPWVARLRTPVGPWEAHLFVRDDVLTLNEVFCREDYPADGSTDVVVDVGSNIGLSALYFLTRSPNSRCYLFEPVPQNVARLRLNLAGLERRYTLAETAVGAEDGMVEFGVEPTGRYGGIGVRTGTMTQVPCEHINGVLGRILAAEGRIDVLKIDTEGQEARTLAAIDPLLLDRLGRVYLELAPGEAVDTPSGFRLLRYGTTWQFYNQSRSSR